MFDQSHFSFSQLKQLFAKLQVVDYLYLAMTGVGLLLVAYGLLLLIRSSNSSVVASVDMTQNGIEASVSSPQVVVEIAGAVTKPGMYSFEVGSRIGQALKAAGNIEKDADFEFVSKQLNLAQQLTDGEKIYIPFLEENESNKQQQSSSASGSERSGSDSYEQSNGKVSINTATQKQLETLSGIGQKRASDIIAQRPYQSLQQLVEMEILTENMFENIKSQIVL